MMEFYKTTCTSDIWTASPLSLGEHDPMVEEALAACAAAVNRSLSFSLLRMPSEEVIRSPEYILGAANWDKLAKLNEEAATLGYGNVIHFGPGSQGMVDGQVATAGITEQVADLILEEHRNAIVESIFVPCEQPILEHQSKATRKKKAGKTAVGGIRRSSRQVVISSMPVSKRATHRLIRAFDLVGPGEPIGDQALEAFAKRFNTPLSKEAMAAVRSLTSLDSAAAIAASIQLVASEGAETMEDVPA
jgi:hypothetical protein